MEATTSRVSFFLMRLPAVDETTHSTYNVFLENMRPCAALYHVVGVRKGDRAALMSYPSTVLCIALFAAFMPGALPVPLRERTDP